MKNGPTHVAYRFFTDLRLARCELLTFSENFRMTLAFIRGSPTRNTIFFRRFNGIVIAALFFFISHPNIVST